MKLWCKWQIKGNLDMIGCGAYMGSSRIILCPHASKLHMILNRLFGWYTCPYRKLKESPNGKRN